VHRRQPDAVRPDDEQAAALQRAGEEFGQQQGGSVGRLQVVEDDDQGAGGCGVLPAGALFRLELADA